MRFFVLFLWFLTSLSYFAQAQEAPRQLTVSGRGQIEAVPDMATLTIGVSHQAKSAREAMAGVSQATGAMLAGMEAAGIAGRDMQTSGLSLSPVQDYSGDGPARLVGFRAASQVTARLRDLSALGPLLDEMVQGGANQIGGLSFGLQEPAPLRDEARARAVVDARHKAEVLARAAGVTLGPVISIRAGEAPRPMPTMEMRSVAMDAPGAVPVAGGELTIGADVQMVFALEE